MEHEKQTIKGDVSIPHTTAILTQGARKAVEENKNFEVNPTKEKEHQQKGKNMFLFNMPHQNGKGGYQEMLVGIDEYVEPEKVEQEIVDYLKNVSGEAGIRATIALIRYAQEIEKNEFVIKLNDLLDRAGAPRRTENKELWKTGHKYTPEVRQQYREAVEALASPHFIGIARKKGGSKTLKKNIQLIKVIHNKTSRGDKRENNNQWEKIYIELNDKMRYHEWNTNIPIQITGEKSNNFMLISMIYVLLSNKAKTERGREKAKREGHYTIPITFEDAKSRLSITDKNNKRVKKNIQTIIDTLQPNNYAVDVKRMGIGTNTIWHILIPVNWRELNPNFLQQIINDFDIFFMDEWEQKQYDIKTMLKKNQGVYEALMEQHQRIEKNTENIKNDYRYILKGITETITKIYKDKLKVQGQDNRYFFELIDKQCEKIIESGKLDHFLTDIFQQKLDINATIKAEQTKRSQ